MARPVKITRQTLANEAYARWCEQYPDGTHGRDKKAIGENIRLLGTSPSPDSVDAAIGNKSWTEVPECNSCGKKSDVVVRVGEDLNYESATANICPKCLAKALLVAVSA